MNASAPRSLAFIALVALGSAAVRAQVTALNTEHAGSKARVMIIDGDATLRLESPTGAPRTISLGSDWKRVSGVRFSPDASRIAIVAEAATPILSVVDVATPRVAATYPIVAAAISPDGRAVMFEQAPRQGNDNVGLLLVALNKPGDPLPEEPPILKLLAGRGSLSRQSELQWTDPEVVAFIVVAGTEASVVAFQVDQAGHIQKQGMKPLLADDFVNASKLAPGASAVKALSGAEITRIPSAGLILRLQFPSNPALRLRTTDVRVWE